MKLFRFWDPRDFRYARAGRRGTWSEGDGLCGGCGASTQRRVQPLVIEWEEGSDIVGDFVWPGFGDVVVSETASEALRKFRSFDLGPVEMIQDPSVKRTPRSKRRIWLPYKGPTLFELWVTKWLDLDFEHSTVALNTDCQECGRKSYSTLGTETWEPKWDKEKGDWTAIRTPRRQGMGIFVNDRELDGANLFRINQYPAAVFCSELLKDYLEYKDLKNLSFLEMGRII